jgi:sarcosine oxidase
MYTTTPDEHFILERQRPVVIGSPCSGHGFKFATAVGARLARMAADTCRRAVLPAPGGRSEEAPHPVP